MKLIVGLGNPGKRYERTRHNLGFIVIERLALQSGIALDKKVCDSLAGESYWGDERMVLAKPQSFMNRSGAAVRCLLTLYEGSADDLVVIYDDLDLPFGRIRIRPNGSAAGHRGMLSILEHLGHTVFYRIRIGIGRPPEGIEPADYVLESFNADESSELDAIVERAAESVVCLVREGPQRAMGHYNQARE